MVVASDGEKIGSRFVVKISYTIEFDEYETDEIQEAARQIAIKKLQKKSAKAAKKASLNK
jgi:hypothetical protein